MGRIFKFRSTAIATELSVKLTEKGKMQLDVLLAEKDTMGLGNTVI
jgi:hypothetical protein